MSDHVENIAGEGVTSQVGSPPDSPPAGEPTRRASSADDILAAVDIDETDVEVPEWGLTVRVRGISRADYRSIEKLSTDASGTVDPELADMHLLVVGMIEPRVSFDQAKAIVDTKSIPSVAKITSAIMEASGLGAGFQT